ncbi:MAG: Gfo/Idh/MocA family oxidoreductase [Pirellulaceae bacterium]
MSGTSRRNFLQAAAASATLMAAPTFIPAKALGRDGETAPSERLTMCAIGTGGKGRHNMQQFQGMKDVQMVAVCDVDKPHSQAAVDLVNQAYGNNDCKSYVDFRELLDKHDLNLACVSTPDHWHALPTIAALNKKLDVYCEKPLTNSIGEGRAICDAAEKNQRIVQTGSHERSNANGRFAAELVRNGYIGRLHTMRINLPCSDGHHQQARSLKGIPEAQEIPEGFDYDMWLGHTAKAPYSKERCHFWWRFVLAYGGGEMTDRGAHVIDLGQMAAGMDDTGPVFIKAKGVQEESLYDVFWDYEFENTYANGLKIIGSTAEPRGVKLEGTDGWVFIHVHGCRLEASDPKLLDVKLGEDHLRLGRTESHHRNFIDSVKARKQPFASAEAGHRTASVCHLNNIAMRLGRPLKWDPAGEKFIDDDEANKLVTPEMRAPWTLG